MSARLVPDLLHGNEQRMYGDSAERIRQIEVAAMKKTLLSLLKTGPAT